MQPLAAYVASSWPWGLCCLEYRGLEDEALNTLERGCDWWRFLYWSSCDCMIIGISLFILLPIFKASLRPKSWWEFLYRALSGLRNLRSEVFASLFWLIISIFWFSCTLFLWLKKLVPVWYFLFFTRCCAFLDASREAGFDKNELWFWSLLLAGLLLAKEALVVIPPLSFSNSKMGSTSYSYGDISL